MAENLKAHVIATVKSLMKPIIKLLLRNGVTYKEFAMLCKSIFVEAAAEGFGLRGRPTNVSRISVLTGIDRKEVKRIKELLQENSLAQDAQTHQDRITRVLTAWHQDPEYTVEGRVRVLPVDGERGSFTALVKRYGGDVPVQALLKELLRVGVVSKLDDGRVKVLSRYFMPVQSDPQALLRAGSMISELGENLFHNLYVVERTARKGRPNTRFDGRASNNFIDAKHHAAFQQFLDSEGQAFLERVDAWLSEHEICESATDNGVATPMRLGVGVFGIEKRMDNPGE